MTLSELFTEQAETLAKEVKTPRARVVAKKIAIDPALNEGILAMMGRKSEMRSPMTALLAGIAAIPAARRMWEDSLDEAWGKNRVSNATVYDEVVIGSGLTAAIYCASRVALGYPPPVILEAKPRAGGTFAVSHGPSFYLNSRNRPGGLSIPGNKGALNFLPGSVVQPSDLSAAEYQVNSDLAFVIRSVFALAGAKVVPNTRAEGLYYDSRYSRSSFREYFAAMQLQDGRRIKAKRIIVATGIGTPYRRWGSVPRLVNFEEFMASLDQPFPLRGMKRVAVIGSGDSGKCVIEALTGQGPAGHMSVASLDWPEEIVWFNQPSINRVDFEACNRPRYKRIGTLLESSPRGRRVQARDIRVQYVDKGYESVFVNGEPFDLAIECTGFNADRAVGARVAEYDFYGDLARKMPRSARDVKDRIFFAGPVAQIPRSAQEQMSVPLPSNESTQKEALVAAYRYAGRTAMLAESI